MYTEMGLQGRSNFIPECVSHACAMRVVRTFSLFRTELTGWPRCVRNRLWPGSFWHDPCVLRVHSLQESRSEFPYTVLAQNDPYLYRQ